MALLLVTSLVLIAIILAYTYLKRCYSRSTNDPPGPAPHIFFGNLISSGLFTGKITFHEVMIDYQRRYGDKFMFWFGSHPCLVFCLPEHAQTIFADRHTFEQSPLFLPNFDLLCPHGIFLLTGAKWKRHIRVMLPMFKRAKVIHYLEAIVDCTDRFIDQYFSNNQVHTNLITRCQSLTMNIIGLIGFDYNLDGTIDSSVKQAFEDFTYYVSLIMMIPWIPRWVIQIYSKLNWKYQRAHRVIHELTEKIVEQEQNNQETMENKRPKNLIASLVSSLNEQANDEQISSGLTRAEMFDEVLVAILAGYETTSTALSWFIFYISKSPRIQQCMKDELREHNLLMTNDVDDLPSLTQENLDSLVY
jgi:cytochrome P450